MNKINRYFFSPCGGKIWITNKTTEINIYMKKILFDLMIVEVSDHGQLCLLPFGLGQRRTS